MSNFDQNVWKKLNVPLFKALESATVFCKLRGTPYVELEHWLQQFYAQEDNDIKRILSIVGVSDEVFEKAVFDAVSKHPTNVATTPSMSEHIIQSIQKAWMYASLSMNDSTIRGAWLLGALWHTPELKQILLKICPDLLALNQLDWAGEVPALMQVSNEGGSTQRTPDGMIPGEFSQAVPNNDAKKSALEQ